MNTTEAKKKWEQVLSFLHEEVTAFNYDTWIAPIVLSAVEDNVVTLEVSEMFLRSNLRKRYERSIIQTVRAVFGEEYETDFVSPGAMADDTRRAAPARMQNSIKLNPRYTFDTFVVGPNNRFASAAAGASVMRPGTLLCRRVDADALLPSIPLPKRCF